MLIYEVNVAVQNDSAAEYAEFLKGHIQEVLKNAGFKAADWWVRQASDESAQGMDGKTLWTIHYQVENREHLDRYLKEKAPALRAEAVDRFGDRFAVTRRILSPMQKQYP